MFEGFTNDNMWRVLIQVYARSDVFWQADLARVIGNKELKA